MKEKTITVSIDFLIQKNENNIFKKIIFGIFIYPFFGVNLFCLANANHKANRMNEEGKEKVVNKLYIFFYIENINILCGLFYYLQKL